MRCNKLLTGSAHCMLLVLLVCCQLTQAQGWSLSSDRSSSSLLADSPPAFLPVEEAYRLQVRGDAQGLLLDWRAAPTYYLYQHKFAVAVVDERGETSPLAVSYPPGKAIYDEYYEKELQVYYDTVALRVDFPAHLKEQAWTLAVSSQGCADAGLCYPPRTQYFTSSNAGGVAQEFVEIDQPPSVAASAMTGADANGATSAAKNSRGLSLPLVLLFAFLGGIILNLMPCVFPVLSIKVLSLTSAHLGEHSKHLHGMAYTAGIVISFVAIAVLLLVFREAGEAVGWVFLAC